MSEITLNVIHRAEDNSRYCAYVCRKVSDEIKRLINVRAIVAELWHSGDCARNDDIGPGRRGKILDRWTDYGKVKALNIYLRSYIERSARPIISGQPFRATK